jgi:hypothetical protein
VCNGAAAPPALRARVCVRTARSTSTWSVVPTGSSTVTNEIRLPSAPASPPSRTLIGTSTLTTPGRSPRRRSARPSASVAAASRTSLIVAWWRRPAVRTASSGTSAKATARRRVADRSRPVAGAGAASWRTAAGRSAPRATVAAAVRATRVAPVTRLRAKAAALARAVGSGRGDHPPFTAPIGGWPAASNGSIATSTAAMPSTSA